MISIFIIIISYKTLHWPTMLLLSHSPSKTPKYMLYNQPHRQLCRRLPVTRHLPTCQCGTNMAGSLGSLLRVSRGNSFKKFFSVSWAVIKSKVWRGDYLVTLIARGRRKRNINIEAIFWTSNLHPKIMATMAGVQRFARMRLFLRGLAGPRFLPSILLPHLRLNSLSLKTLRGQPILQELCPINVSFLPERVDLPRLCMLSLSRSEPLLV